MKCGRLLMSIASTVMVLFSFEASACQCRILTNESNQKVLKESYSIIKAKIASVETVENEPTVKHIELDVVYDYHGHHFGNKNISLNYQTKHRCDTRIFKVGQFYNLILYKDEKNDDIKIRNYCTDLTSEAWDTLRRRLIKNQGSTIPNRFKNKEELEKWAKTSAFGGGTLEQVNFEGLRLMVANRMHTSGMKTSEISVYIYQKDGSYILKNVHQMVYDTIRIENKNKTLSFITEKENDVLFSFTLKELIPNIVTEKK